MSQITLETEQLEKACLHESNYIRFSYFNKIYYFEH